jgi:hypothetical protein
MHNAQLLMENYPFFNLIRTIDECILTLESTEYTCRIEHY